LAARAWGALAGDPTPGVVLQGFSAADPAAALLPLLAAFAEAGFREAFIEALQTVSQRNDAFSALFAGDREAAFRLMGLLWHDMALAPALKQLPENAWLVAGEPPSWLPGEGVIMLKTPPNLLGRLSLVVAPRTLGPVELGLASNANVLVFERDPRESLELPAPLAEIVASSRNRALLTFGDTATLAPGVFSALARTASPHDWFFHDGYDARYTAMWANARVGAGSTENAPREVA
jgi:hypothetical protein